MRNFSQAPDFLAVDFYCGAGGTTRGLLDAGGYVIAGIDKDLSCRKTYVHNNPNTTLDYVNPEFLHLDMFPESADYPRGEQSDVYARLRELIPKYRRMIPTIPLLFAICAPCQSFTKFVQRKITPGRSETRERDKSLLSQTIGFIHEFQPELIISENVSGIERGEYTKIWNGFQAELRKMEYSVGSRRVCASRFGIPQYRRRAILMAVKQKTLNGFAFDIPIPDQDTEAPPLPSVRGVLNHLPPLQAGEKCDGIPNHICRNLTEINRLRLRSVRPGEPNFDFANSPYGDLSLPCHRRLKDSGNRGFGDVYTRIHPDRPSPSITTRFISVSNGRFGHYDEGQVRGLSLREGAALQSFADDYEFFGDGMDTIARWIGNAVPPKLLRYMTERLLSYWQDGANTLSPSV